MAWRYNEIPMAILHLICYFRIVLLFMFIIIIFIGDQSEFVRYGGQLRDGEPVIEVTPGTVISVQTPKHVYKSRYLVLALGPWAAKFLPRLGLQLPLQVMGKSSLCSCWYTMTLNPHSRYTPLKLIEIIRSLTHINE